jgi:co-chaperonin GroES (HSP10)
MKAIGRFVIISKIAETIEVGNIIVTDEVQFKKAKVVSPGTEVTEVIEGDIVYYNSAQEHSLYVKGELFTLIKISDIAFVA